MNELEKLQKENKQLRGEVKKLWAVMSKAEYMIEFGVSYIADEKTTPLMEQTMQAIWEYKAYMDGLNREDPEAPGGEVKE